ncbi:hypothetical protein RB195_016922 [Necator americanus]|uniref:Uncharacterized protein n=1 Tax=Necator americanus TaxID=51031 RepID=A0ABR1C5X0_NECAM
MVPSLHFKAGMLSVSIKIFHMRSLKEVLRSTLHAVKQITEEIKPQTVNQSSCHSARRNVNDVIIYV